MARSIASEAANEAEELATESKTVSCQKEHLVGQKSILVLTPNTPGDGAIRVGVFTCECTSRVSDISLRGIAVPLFNV
jgi:hypothetical protein